MQPEDALKTRCARAVSAHVCAAADVVRALMGAAARVKTAAAALQRTHCKRLDDAFEEMDANANVLRAWHQCARHALLHSSHVPVFMETDVCAPCIQLMAPAAMYAFGEARAFSISPSHCIVSDLETWMTHAPSLVEARLVQPPAVHCAHGEEAEGIAREDMELRFTCACTGVPIEVHIDVLGEYGRFRVYFKIPDAYTSVLATLLAAGTVVRQWTVRRIGALGLFQHAVQQVPFEDARLENASFADHFRVVCRVSFLDDGMRISAEYLNYRSRVLVAAPQFTHFTHSVLDPQGLVHDDTLRTLAVHKLKTLHPHYASDLLDLVLLPGGSICALRMFRLDQPYGYSMDFYVLHNDLYQWQRRIVISDFSFPAKLVLIDNEQIGVADNGEFNRVRLYALRSGTVLHTFQLPERPAWIAWRQQRLLIFTDQLHLLVYA